MRSEVLTSARSQTRLSAALVVCLFLLLSTGHCQQLDAQPPSELRAALRNLHELEQRFTATPPVGAPLGAWQNLGTAIRRARFILRFYPSAPNFTNLLSQAIADARYWHTQLSSDSIPPVRLGSEIEGYYSTNDGSFQPFVRYLPRKVSKNKPLPLLVYLHGYSPYLDLVNWATLPQSLLNLAEQDGFCVAAPFGRGNTDYQGIGEQDVLRVIREMRLRYPIDGDRIVLAGVSMGGMGVWTVGAHYPHLFAGLLVISGRADYYTWQGINPQDLPDYKRKLVDAEFAYSLLPNLANLPIMCIHGDADTVIAVREARHMIRALRKVNPTVRYVEVEGGDHWIYERVSMRRDVREWLRNCRRTVPVEFEYVTYLPRYTDFHWVGAESFKLSEFPARIVVRRSSNTVQISAQGLKGVWIDSRRIPTEIRNLPIIGLNGLNISFDTKKPVLPRYGPIKDAFLQPFLFVQTGNPSDVTAAEKFREAVLDWYNFSKAFPRFAHEATVTPGDLGKYNFFIFGEPESSRLVATILATSPVQIVQDAFHVGPRSFPRQSHGLYLVRPSPWNVGRLAVLQCGVPWGKGLPENHKYDFLPDFIIYTTAFDADGSNSAVCAGFFDENWELDERLIWKP